MVADDILITDFKMNFGFSNWFENQRDSFKVNIVAGL